MSMDDYDGDVILRDIEAYSFLTFVLQVRENPEKNLTQETCPGRGSNSGPLRDRCAYYHLFLILLIYTKYKQHLILVNRNE